MNRTFYVLNKEGNPIIEESFLKWGEWMEKCDRHVGDDTVEGSRISTVFLGLDHSFEIEGPPVLWETMVFEGLMNGEMERCAGTREQAEAMHVSMIEKVKQAYI